FLGQFRAAQRPLSAKEFSEFQATLGNSGVYLQTPVGLRLPSNQFYWTIAACRDGHFHFNAFLSPSERYARLIFPEFLFARDATGIPINRARPIPAGSVFDVTMAGQPRDEVRPDFNPFMLTVEPDGLGGLARLF